MAEQVGGIYYEVSLDTSKMIDGQRRVDRELRTTTGSLDSFKSRLAPIAAAISVMAAALASLKIAKMADEFRLLGARVEVAAGSVEAGAVAFSSLVDISRRTQSSLAGNIEVFNRLNQSILQMGGTQADTLKVTELLAKAIKVSGASAVEAKAAMLQFGQALGSGKLQGDELRSLMENAPYLMRQLADGIGVPVGALKKLGEEGKLTADVVTNALTKAADKIDADFKKFPQTIESALVVAQDAAGLAALKFDELTGSSAVLTGVTKGLGEVLEKLGDQFGAVNEQAGALGRNGQITTWSELTRTAFSYVVDAADVVWQALSTLSRNVSFVFKGVGAEIGGIGAQVVAVMRGDFSGAAAIGDAMRADADQRRKELDAADAKTLAGRKLFGQQMREAWEQGAGGGRGSVNPSPAASKLKPAAGGDSKGPKFDPAAYLAALRAAQNDELAVIAAKEVEGMRIARKNLDAKKISQQQYNEAVALVYEKAETDRAEFSAKTTKHIIDEAKRMEEESARDRKEMMERRSTAKEVIASADPVAAIRLEEERRIAVMESYRLLDLANAQMYEDAKVEIHRQSNDQIIALQAARDATSVSMAADVAGQLFQVAKNSGKEQTTLGKTLFLASKALAVAEIILNTEVAAAKAGAQLGIFGLPMAGLIRAQGYASAGIVSGMAIAEVSGGRQYGGPVNSGSLYRVNEGGRPEMFTAANGSQYMMPNTSGSVTPSGAVGGRAPNVIVNINTSANMQEQSRSWDERTQTVEITIAELTNQVNSNSGKFFSALRNSTNVKGRM